MDLAEDAKTISCLWLNLLSGFGSLWGEWKFSKLVLHGSFQNWLDMVKGVKKSCFKNGNGFIGFIVFGRSAFSLADKHFLAVLKLQVRT